MFHEMKRLARHSGVYGVGLLVPSVLGVVLLPLYTRYLTRADYGVIETLIAGSGVLAIVLRAGVSNAFFRFYFDGRDPIHRSNVVNTSFWYTMTMATAGLVAVAVLAGPISEALFGRPDRASLVRAAAVGLWAAMNYEQLVSVLRAEERSTHFTIASLANLVVAISVTLLLVVTFQQGPLGVLVGNFMGMLTVYVVLLAYRREQLRAHLDRKLLGRMQRFGTPLAAAVLALWAIGFIDRFFLVKLAGEAETGVYSMGVRVASVVLVLFAAFRTAWPAFAYSIEDDEKARRTYGYVLTYLTYLTCWTSLALSLLSPWLVRILAPSSPAFWPGSRPVALLAFGTSAFAAYTVVAIGLSRVRRTEFNWVITGAAAALNIIMNALLIPRYGMMGAAVATLTAYVAMFLGIVLHAQRIFPVPYQWRRVALIIAVSGALTVLGKVVDASLPLAVALAAAFPLALVPLGFYLPEERAHLRRLVPVWRS